MPRQKRADILSSVAANVYELRTQRGMTQEALAERVDLTSRYVQNIERGKARGLTVELLEQLATALGAEVTELLVPARLPPVKYGRPRNRVKP